MNNNDLSEWAGESAPAFFSQYGIAVVLSAAKSAPAITRFEYTPLRSYSTAALRRAGDRLRNLYGYSVESLPGGGFALIVPNAARSYVSFAALCAPLREFCARPENSLCGHFVPLCFGRGADGYFLTDIASCAHILIAGTTGSGKSCLVNSIICETLAFSDATVALIDPKKGAEFGVYEQPLRSLRRLFAGYIADDCEKAERLLRSLCALMDERFAAMGKASLRRSADPPVIVFVDELADLVCASNGDEINGCLCRIAQMGRAANIHLILATQDPRTSVVTGLIKYNMNVKICMKTANKQHSRNLIDCGDGAELLGNGDAIVKKGGDLTRVQCPYISDEEIKKIILA